MKHFALLGLLAAVCAQAELRPTDVEHVMVSYEAGRFSGWPANHGIWSWGDEILVGFTEGAYKYLGPYRHAIDREKPEKHLLARSLDGGKTWTLTDPAPDGYLIPEGGFLHGVEREDVEVPEARDPEGGIDFAHPDFAMTVRTTDIHAGESRYWYSYDRGRTWEGPFRLPNFGAPGTAARTDYIVDGPETCTLFITVAKENEQEGRVICVRTADGGATWEKVGDIGPEPKGFKIMPATVRLSEDELLTVLRCREGNKRWQEAYLSEDNGSTWTYLNDPVEDAGEGNPASLIKLDDGRLCLSYGYRAEPYSIRVKFSGDNGRSWGPGVVLRDDGANRDVGYTRMVQRPDGKVVVLYYFNDEETGPERYIAATIFDPDSIEPAAE